VSVQLALPFGSSPLAPVAPFAPTNVSPIAPTNVSLIAPTSVSPIARTSTSEIYFVRHRSARRYRLRVDPDGRARVTIPRGGSRRDADAFVQRHRDWIAAQRTRLASPVSAVELGQGREQAPEVLPQRLRDLAREHGLTIAKVSIRNQRTRWGSCGRDGHICLNWRLMLMPEWVRDYVLIHELMHLRRLDHSPQYWKLVAAACPEFRKARQWLRLNGPSLR
jgi:predicted metal-dependent hydrolase